MVGRYPLTTLGVDRRVLGRASRFFGLLISVLVACAWFLPPSAEASKAHGPVSAHIDSAKVTNLGADHAEPNYLDKDQQRIGRKLKGCIDELIEFQDTIGDLNPDSVPAASYKAWTDSEREVVRGILSRLISRAPGLLVRAAAGGRIPFHRQAIVKIRDASETLKFGHFLASSPQGEIVLSDEFFRYPNSKQHDILVHEIVHVADIGQRISLSRTWVSFAEPVISNVRKEWQNAPTRYHVLNRSVRESATWPSVYGSHNLVEALAEYTMTYINEPSFPIKPEFKSNIAPMILLPGKRDAEWAQDFRRGLNLYSQRSYDAALVEFEKADALDHSSATLHEYMEYAYLKKKDFDHALEQSNIAFSRLAAADVPELDPYRLHFLQAHAYVLMNLDRLDEAKSALDTLLHEQPRNVYARNLRTTIVTHLAIANSPNRLEESMSVGLMARNFYAGMPSDEQLRKELDSFIDGQGTVLHGLDLFYVHPAAY